MLNGLYIKMKKQSGEVAGRRTLRSPASPTQAVTITQLPASADGHASVTLSNRHPLDLLLLTISNGLSNVQQANISTELGFPHFRKSSPVLCRMITVFAAHNRDSIPVVRRLLRTHSCTGVPYVTEHQQCPHLWTAVEPVAHNARHPVHFVKF